MFIFTTRIYKFFADLRNVRRFVAIQIVKHHYMAPAIGHCAITWLLPTVGPVRSGASQFALRAPPSDSLRSMDYTILFVASGIRRTRTYRPRATDCIQAIISVRTSGAKVSSISLYSPSSPVVQCWKRWFSPSFASITTACCSPDLLSAFTSDVLPVSLTAIPSFLIVELSLASVGSPFRSASRFRSQST